MKRETLFDCHCDKCKGDDGWRLQKFHGALCLAGDHLPQILRDIQSGNPVAMAFAANIGAELEIVLAKSAGALDLDKVQEKLLDDQAILDYMAMVDTPSEELCE